MSLSQLSSLLGWYWQMLSLGGLFCWVCYYTAVFFLPSWGPQLVCFLIAFQSLVISHIISMIYSCPQQERFRKSRSIHSLWTRSPVLFNFHKIANPQIFYFFHLNIRIFHLPFFAYWILKQSSSPMTTLHYSSIINSLRFIFKFWSEIFGSSANQSLMLLIIHAGLLLKWDWAALHRIKR